MQAFKLAVVIDCRLQVKNLKQLVNNLLANQRLTQEPVESDSFATDVWTDTGVWLLCQLKSPIRLAFY